MHKWGACAIGLTVLMTAGCGGTRGNPIDAYQPGDEEKSCARLQSEINSNEDEILRLVPHEDATGKNVALGVAGALFIIPWFFMDFKDGERIELQALERRNQWLRGIALDNDCTLAPARVQLQAKPGEGETDTTRPDN